MQFTYRKNYCSYLYILSINNKSYANEHSRNKEFQCCADNCKMSWISSREFRICNLLYLAIDKPPPICPNFAKNGEFIYLLTYIFTYLFIYIIERERERYSISSSKAFCSTDILEKINQSKRLSVPLIPGRAEMCVTHAILSSRT